MTTVLRVRDFAYRPGPRYIVQGPHSGELYRQTILAPAVREAIATGGKLVVDLDGTGGIGRSFLEEISGGLIREDRIPYDQLMQHIEFSAKELPVYKSRVTTHLEAAHAKEGI